MAKLNRDEILRGLLQTLVDGWGRGTVEAVLKDLGSPAHRGKKMRSGLLGSAGQREHGAAALISNLEVTPDRKAALRELAERFDEGSAFPKMGDIRSFLAAHQQSGAELKGRVAAFKRMLPVLSTMSPKGLEKLIARSHHSGPADLGAISDAIRGAGEDLRGTPEAHVKHVRDDTVAPAEDAAATTSSPLENPRLRPFER